MKTLRIDIESFSEADLPKTGVYPYAEHPSFEILLFGVSIDDGPVTVYDLAQGEEIPPEILSALTDNSITKWAFNAQFERICLSRYLRDLGRIDGFLDPRGWRCDMVWAGYMGFPMNLKGAGAALGLEQQKMEEGREMITYFCKPYRPTSRNGHSNRNLPHHAPEKWELFKAYNKRDVEVELAIAAKLSHHPVPEQVWSEYWTDQTINDRGILIDLPMVKSAIKIDSESKQHLVEEMKYLSGVANPQSVIQMQRWLRENGVELDSLGKKELQDQLAGIEEPMRSVLLLRQQLAMSAVKKYHAMETAACADGRCRGMFQFYGANRSGRFAGRIVQLQNLFRNSLPDLMIARDLVKAGNYDALASLYDSVPEVLAQCVRTAFIPAPGYKFIVCDFSAIEARVIAWLAGESWRMEAFAEGKDIYCASASQMFGVPVEKHGINGHLRQKGKIAELALGYGGSVGALTAMGALDMGLTEDELPPLVTAWRQANPNITKLWWAVDRAVKTAVKEKRTTSTHGLEFKYQGGMLYITLPSGRQLSYVQPRMGDNRFGGESVTYMGTDMTKHWSRIESYGPKFVENCIGKGTLIITNHGLIPVENITAEMKIWDGEEFVSHDGLIQQGKKRTISVNGIHMTPDHKILTEGGWKRSVESSGLNWAAVSLPDGFEPGGEYAARKKPVALQMCMREGSSCFSKASEEQEKPGKILWMHEKQADQRSTENPWHEPSSGMGSMAQHETALPRSESSCLSQLWWTWHHGLRTLAGKLRELLGGHGSNLEERPGFGSDRQRRKLLSGKLPLGEQKEEYEQQKDVSACQGYAVIDDIQTDRNREVDTALSYQSQLANRVIIEETGLSEQVYDILNCGSRHRFAVWNGERALIVSNCVQGISRDILCHAMECLHDYRIVAHVHDECIVECSPETTVETISNLMATVPNWAPGLILRADGYECMAYQKD